MKRLHTLMAAVMLSVAASAQTTLFNGGHHDAPLGLTLGYVNKGWRTNMEGHVVRENLWGDKNKLMHGIQFGFNFQPCFHFGLGAHTGVFFEQYISVAPSVLDLGYDRFTESSLYVPLHAMYRIPFTRNFSLSLFGGMGMNWAIAGSYNKHRRITGADVAVAIITGVAPDPYYPAKWQEYGGGEWPKRVNLQWEFGGTIRYSLIQVGFTYSIGMTDHHFYPGYLTRQDKMNISLTFVTDFKGNSN